MLDRIIIEEAKMLLELNITMDSLKLATDEESCADFIYRKYGFRAYPGSIVYKTKSKD